MNPETKRLLNNDALFGLNWAGVAMMIGTALVVGLWFLIAPSTAGSFHGPNARLPGVATAVGCLMHITLRVAPRFVRIPSYWLTGAATVLLLVLY